MAAGLGFKDFVTGEVLTAADVDGYLMQGVWVFASAAARDAAVTAPSEGNFAYLKDTNVTTYYTGSAWANLDTTGMTNPMTTTGDTIYSSSGSTPARLGIGSTGNVLTVAGGVPTWAAPAAAASGMTLISRTEFSNVASQTFDGVFNSTYYNYLAVIDYILAGTFDDTLHLQFRYAGPTTQAASYYGSSLEQPRTGAQVLTSSDNANQFTITADVGGTSDNYGSGQIYFESVGNVSTNATYNGKYVNGYTAGQYIIGGNVNVQRIYTGFLLKAAGSNITGAVSIYGLAKA
jgi:hypothetical protein